MLRHRTDERSLRFRRELGLPTDRAIVMTGHQAEFWHPGIAAKYIAADVFAGAAGARCASVVVDQEPQEAAMVRYPARDSEGRLVVRAREHGGGGVAARAGAHDESIAPVREGLAAIDAAFARFEGERLAARVALATRELLRTWLRHEAEPAMVFATELWRTTLMGEFVDRMKREPERVCAAYNAAARRHAGAGIRELLVNEVQDVYELPLWRMRGDGSRERVYAEMLDSVPREELAPRALLMTALLRLAGCDLFIHGMGGAGEEEAGREGYDRVMEEWLGKWLGIDAGALAPATMVTATMRLPLMEGGAPTREEIARAVWLAHHARHDPAVVGEQARAAEKRRLVEAIARVPRERKAERAEGFDALQVFLEGYREACRGELLRLASAAEGLKRRAEEAEIAGDRTWAFALYPAASMDALRGEIEMAFG